MFGLTLSRESEKEKLMKLKDLRKMDTDQVLGLIGLETKRSPSDALLTGLGTFSLGVLVGAGVALLLAPKSGRELRKDLGDKLQTVTEKPIGNGKSLADLASNAR